MGYGIRAYSREGRVLVDSERSGFTQIMSGTLSLSISYSHSYYGEISIPAAYSSHGDYLVAYKPPLNKMISYWGKKLLVWHEHGPTSVPYRVFAQTSYVSPSSDPWGLRIFGSDGTLRFDSGLRTFNVLSSHTSELDKTVPYNGEWMIAGSSGIRGLANIGGYNGAFLTCFLANRGGYISAENLPFDLGPQTTISQSSNSPYSVMRINIV